MGAVVVAAMLLPLLIVYEFHPKAVGVAVGAALLYALYLDLRAR